MENLKVKHEKRTTEIIPLAYLTEEIVPKIIIVHAKVVARIQGTMVTMKHQLSQFPKVSIDCETDVDVIIILKIMIFLKSMKLGASS